MCYGVLSDMNHGPNSTVFRVLFPKISTGQIKLAPTGWHGWYVFATLVVDSINHLQKQKACNERAVSQYFVVVGNGFSKMGSYSAYVMLYQILLKPIQDFLSNFLTNVFLLRRLRLSTLRWLGKSLDLGSQRIILSEQKCDDIK